MKRSLGPKIFVVAIFDGMHLNKSQEYITVVENVKKVQNQPNLQRTGTL
jgi:hypothetical protein